MTALARRHSIAGNWASLLLPIGSDDSIEFDKLGEEIDILIQAGVDGIYSNGTAGEFHNQTEAEFDRIQADLAARCEAAKMPFVIGACQPDATIMLGRVRRALALKPLAIQVVLPDWWPLTIPEAIDFLKRTADVADGTPLILYNPPHAKRVLAPKELAEVCDPCPSVVGIKLADGDAGWYADARDHLSEFALFIPGHHLATGMKEGIAAGAFSNVACLSPRGAQWWTDLMRSDIERALDLEQRICSFMSRHIVPFRDQHGYSNAALDKLLSAIGGWGPVGTKLRWPYHWIDESEAIGLRAIATQELPELFN